MEAQRDFMTFGASRTELCIRELFTDIADLDYMPSTTSETSEISETQSSLRNSDSAVGTSEDLDTDEDIVLGTVILKTFENVAFSFGR